MKETTKEPIYRIRFQRHSITGAAEDYYYAGRLCLDEFKKTFDSHYLFPALVNYAFAGELYLKAVYIFENNKESRNIHSYHDLLAQLSEQTQEQVEHTYSCNDRKDCFSDAIKHYGDAFTKWRYRHEIVNADSNVYDFVALIDAIKTTCEQKEAQIIAEMQKSEGTI